MIKILIVLILIQLTTITYTKANVLTDNKKSVETQYPDSLNKKGIMYVAGAHSVLYTGTLWYLNDIWYKGRASVPFHFYNDNAGYLQIDKFGHATTAYHESRISYYSFRKVGLLYGF
jgi:hypothetical protein